jgi:hypothetical protein
MSLTFTVYCNHISEEIFQNAFKKIDDYGTISEVRPNMKWMESDGYVLIKFQLINPDTALKGKNLLSGFELLIGKLDPEELQETQELYDELDSNNQGESFENYSMQIIFIYGGSNCFEMRYAMLMSSILSEMTNGFWICSEEMTFIKNKKITKKDIKNLSHWELIDIKEGRYEEFSSWEEYDKEQLDLETRAKERMDAYYNSMSSGADENVIINEQEQLDLERRVKEEMEEYYNSMSLGADKNIIKNEQKSLLKRIFRFFTKKF